MAATYSFVLSNPKPIVTDFQAKMFDISPMAEVFSSVHLFPKEQ